ncbi:cytochrome c oxidase assembly protein [Streptomyces sp. NPDC016626]|uniref:cytochrome c oxidase assembly protein n=1 Tax=Streptomyces sp. NPDC016626 TaxID=3364968 RepID=UPI0036F6553E
MARRPRRAARSSVLVTAGPPPVFGPAAAFGCVLICAAYVLAAAGLRRRGDAWPWARDCAFAAGGAALLWGLCGRLPGGPFTAHSVRHLLIAMAGPVLLVIARPLTLTLRVLPPGRVRRGLVGVAHSAPVGWLLFPPAAAVVDIGGLWVLYRTGLLSATHHHPVISRLTDLHLLVAGLLFSFAVCQLEPVRRRWGLPLRAATLLAAGAAHAVLAKSLYAAGPPGSVFEARDLRLGAQVMYYGGDAVEVVLALVLAVRWYAVTGRRRGRRTASPVRGGAGGTRAPGAPHGYRGVPPAGPAPGRSRGGGPSHGEGPGAGDPLARR